MASKKILIEIGVVDKNVSPSLKKAKDGVDGLAKSTENYNKKLPKGREQSGLNNAILIETGRVASDASFGMQGIANNISRLIELGQEFARSGRQKGNLAESFKQLKASLIGTGGALIAIQLLISFLPKIIKKFQEWRDNIDPVSSALSELGEFAGGSAGDFEIYIRTLESATKSNEEKEKSIKALRKEFPEYITRLDEAGVSLDDVKNKTKDARLQNDLYRQSLIELATAEAARTKIQELATERLEKVRERDLEAQELGFKNYSELVDAQRKAEEDRANGLIMVSGTIAGTLDPAVQDLTKSISEGHTERINEIDELINQYMKYTKIVLDTGGKEKDESDKKKRYSMLEVQNFRDQIRAIEALGRVRTSYNEANNQLLVNNIENEQVALEAERQNALKRLELLNNELVSEEQFLAAKDALNSYYNNLEIERAEDQFQREQQMRLQMFGFIANGLGSLSALAEKNSKQAKTLALAEIVANTAIGFSQGLIVAQEQSKAGSALAFPLFYASQVAAVLAAASRAKQVLESGNIGGGTGSGGTVQAPNFNIVGASRENQLARAVAGERDKPLRAFVVASDLTEVVDENNTNTETSKI